MMSQTAGSGCAGCSKNNCGEVAQRHGRGPLRWIGGGTRVSNDHGVRALELAGRCQRIVVNVKSRDERSP